MASAYEQLLKQLRRIGCLREISELLNWDLETGMPVGADEARADQAGVVAELEHSLSVDPHFIKLLEDAEEEASHECTAASVGDSPYALDNPAVKAHLLRLVRRDVDKNRRIPSELAADLTAACSKAQSVWLKARQAKDFSMFKESLEQVVELCRREAECIGYKGHIYDALLDIYEPGMTTAEIDKVFSELRPALVDLVSRIAKARKPELRLIERKYPVSIQRAFCHRIMTDMGYDWTRGKLDDVVHPFCCSFSTRDVRVTNNFSETAVTKAMFTALHETGHAIYEQGSPKEWIHMPLEGGASMAVHESESRLWENIIGRSRAFWEHYYPVFKSYFPAQTEGIGLDEFHKAVNYVVPSFIRTEADEVTYSLHIMLRFELEKALIDGSLDVKDVPEAWNSAMHDYLGIVPPDDALGCLQDVHWPSGLFGYFPAYALGNLIGAQTFEAMGRDLGDMDEVMRAGELGKIRGWLNSHIYVWGQRLYPAELLKEALGVSLSAQPFIDYLNRKYGVLYGL